MRWFGGEQWVRSQCVSNCIANALMYSHLADLTKEKKVCFRSSKNAGSFHKTGEIWGT